jgi:hypothetical protein
MVTKKLLTIGLTQRKRSDERIAVVDAPTPAEGALTGKWNGS